MSAPANPLAVMRSRAYLRLLLLAVALGVPIAALAFGFLKLTQLVQQWAFTDLARAAGYSPPPVWWPLLPLALAGLVVGLTVRFLPGRGGEQPTQGFSAGGGLPVPAHLPGIFLAAVAGIGLGAVIGPEMPLIALGGGLAYLAVFLARRDVPARAGAVIAATGSFAAISTLFGTPLAGAFLLLEASSVGGLLATAVLLPGLLGAGIGALVFTGLDSLTGFGTYSLTLPDLPAAGAPTVAEFGWAVVVGLLAGPLCVGLRRVALAVAARVGPRPVWTTTVLGLVIAGLAIGYAEVTGHGVSDVLFSGQNQLPGLVGHASTYSVAALLVLLVAKAVAYVAALSAFRGGPTFPVLFLGAAGGLALSHLPGLSMVPAIAMGMGAMTAAMLRLPMTAVLITSLLLGSDGFPVIPLTIVAVVVSYVAQVWLTPAPAPAAPAPAPDDAPPPDSPGMPTPRSPGSPLEPALGTGRGVDRPEAEPH
jgi:H+/Cl- antiporter ClcA